MLKLAVKAVMAISSPPGVTKTNSPVLTVSIRLIHNLLGLIGRKQSLSIACICHYVMPPRRVITTDPSV